ncbi:hypothetical protein G9272_41030 [Streptomyces asoensis]|uniref:DUF11 domain-containing protein n=1 Tax=Streptomyces asoensis TaxID=249586 RepID=A0A6M4WZE1_9ACTN|nr:hypothetical protein [Streptomyces asoensis]QJT05927.1 hypothetical protein G9272_41030 [Streptomyces asoensis]
MAEHARHRFSTAVVFLIALGTAVRPVWVQPQQSVGVETTLRAEPSTVPVTNGTRRETDGPLPTRHPSRRPQLPNITRVLPTTAVHGADLAQVGTALTVGVSQSSPADYIPVTETVKGRVGDTVVVRLGVTNLGPGSPDGEAGSFAVVPPPGTTVTSIPWEGDDDDRKYACQPPQDTDNYYFLCDFSPPAGSSITIGFHIRIDKRIPGAKGSVTVYGPNDSVPGNDRDTIPVDAASAPLWRWQNPLWHWHHWPLLAAAALAVLAPAGRWFVRRRSKDQA